ncbi:MAG: hypothetical protein ACO1QS_16575, partial [Verrucomicrobiota bacterium]
MSVTLGACGCCAGNGEPPVDPPGDGPDPSWTSGLYFATKFAAMWVQGLPLSTAPFDDGVRYAWWELFAEAGGSGIVIQQYWPFFDFAVGNERPFDARIEYIFATTPDFGGFVGAIPVQTQEVSPGILGQVDEKLAAGQFLKGLWTLCYQPSPSGWTGEPYNDGVRSGSRQFYPDLPAEGAWATSTRAGSTLPAYDLTLKARGDLTAYPDHSAPSEGQAIMRQKQVTQLGYKKTNPADPETASFGVRRFAIPEGYYPIRCHPTRVGDFGLLFIENGQIGNNLKIPANATITSSSTEVFNDGEHETFDPEPLEVIIFSEASAAAMITPLPALRFAWRVLRGAVLQVRLVIWHEEPYLKHEIWRDGVLVATIEEEPFGFTEKTLVTGIGFGGYQYHNHGTTLNITVRSSGYLWEFVDEDVVEGEGYTYEIRSYHHVDR